VNDEHSAILQGLPDKQPRSRLEPYRELIVELRSRKLTFQDIAVVLAEKCGVRVTGSGIHDFLRRRSRQTRTKSSSPQPRSVPRNRSAGPISEQREGQRDATGTMGTFEFDPDEPLILNEASRPGAKGTRT
jgi:hypothetical protein